jgi:DNA repair ATPase RecN
VASLLPLIGSFAAYLFGLYDAIETAEYFLRETNAQVNRYLNNIERIENEISSLYTKLENIKKMEAKKPLTASLFLLCNS